MSAIVIYPRLVVGTKRARSEDSADYKLRDRRLSLTDEREIAIRLPKPEMLLGWGFYGYG